MTISCFLKKYRRRIGSSMMVVLLGSGTYFSTEYLYCLRSTYPQAEDPLYLPNGNYLQLLSLDLNGILSDLFWIKGAIYFGSHYRTKRHDYKWLFHLLTIATELDPYYYDVYWYGSSILPSVEQSITLLNKGMSFFPYDWRFPEMIGFYYHFYLKDYPSAAHYYEMASYLPGHPPYVPSLAGRFYAEAGDINAAIRVLKNFYDTSERKDLKNDFAKRIKQLEDIKLLEEKVEEFVNIYQRTPHHLSELVETGIIPSLPDEPYGGRYCWNNLRQRVVSSTDPLYEIHNE